jgi:hypothetical protein
VDDGAEQRVWDVHLRGGSDLDDGHRFEYEVVFS